MQDILRKEVKMLKALQGISYKDIAEYVEIKTNSLYCWLRGSYDLSIDKAEHLKNIIDTIKEYDIV